MSSNNIETITHTASGSQCQIHLYGATVLSFTTKTTDNDTRNHLFVSKHAKLDGSIPIRGGIPICFPIFGPAPDQIDLPQHGFARRNLWTIVPDRSYNHETAAGRTLRLNLAEHVTEGRGSDDNVHNPWSRRSCDKDGTDCTLLYEVRVEAKQLTTTLIIQNTGKDSFHFNALLHTYYAVDQHAATDSSKTHITGLGGYAITDKVTGDSGHVQSYDDPVVLQGEVDRIYIHPEDHPVVHAKIATGTTAPMIRLEAAGQVNEQVAPVSCVVWNPSKDKATAMADFGNDEYHDMVCVEPGLLGHQPLLEPGHEARLTQSIIVIS